MNADETVIDLRDIPVAIDIETSGSHDAVVTALASHFISQGHEIHQLWVGDLGGGTSGMFDIHVPAISLLIDIKTTDTIISLDPHRFLPWREAGYQVWVVAPHDKIGKVERRISNAVDRVLPWRAEGPKIVFEELPANA